MIHPSYYYVNTLTFGVAVETYLDKELVFDMHVNCCPVCQSSTGNHYLVREMMLGTRDTFLYSECAECGCLFLADIPDDLDQYYPLDVSRRRARPSSILRKLRNALYLSRYSFLVNWRRRNDLDVIRRIKLKKNMTFLEVGSKSGSLLGDLRELGYDVHGVNYFVQGDIKDSYGAHVECKSLTDIKGKFDVILFRHALEHMPINMLALAREHLKSDGSCVVCIPLLGWAWQTYATDWAELDAPRHLFVHTRKSFALLAERSGFQIDKVVFDSTEYQLWASNWHQRNVPLADMPQPTRQQRSHMRHLAESLNLTGKGDTAQFYLKPA